MIAAVGYRGIAKARDGPDELQAVSGKLQADGVLLGVLANDLESGDGQPRRCKRGRVPGSLRNPGPCASFRRSGATMVATETTISRFDNEQIKYDLFIFYDD
ncbi:hypothetical protein ALO95_101921 [Pseudomonas syringae pv. antirrhini]|uniref:Uncharacterized protein n=4 Tax=Pseudomonas syringae group TaxID=136849 RepID=A0A0Q0F6X9_PSESX|nr:hypothetical protein ALO88_102295 [Pseudomonas syringae pv. antirrhini]KPX76337.1 hypothetical protein ALO84_101868 [Pseudomonas syringae pv. maculicola]KPY59494.1 Unknown protein sequence [Pseudomonas syringae pv. spinaceae]KPY88239.1 hypothetical protein ALO36_103344 [Pseudomonas syringae pv. tomato]RMM13856.1 hypothetical protein ALQ85_102139 [Pseudomonas syringae]RMN40706.1 hypothetical protein ALQ59_102369 [Pseudomonas syringae pv. apii]RMR17945.1 hypothetical protein ALP89_102138 [Ps